LVRQPPSRNESALSIIIIIHNNEEPNLLELSI